MRNFQNQGRLVQALRTLHKHRNQIESFYHAFLDLQVSSHNRDQLLRDAFRCSVSERRLPTLKDCQEAIADFDEIRTDLFGSLKPKIPMSTTAAHQRLFEGLCTIRNVDQKIAAMFLKFVVVYLGEWPELQHYLFVPVDTNVLNILRTKLEVYSGPWDTPPYVKQEGGMYIKNDTEPCANYRRYLEFQEELGAICRKAGVERILADELWLVRHVFCKPLPLCNRCWIRQWCQSPIS